MSKIDLLNWHDGDIRKERKIDKKGKIGMIRNLISFMIIFMFSVGCNNNITGTSCPDCYLMLDIPDLSIDDNNYYNLNVLSDYIQTFAVVEADIGVDYENVGWTSDTYVNIEHMGFDNIVSVVNGSSYSNENGIANTVLGVYNTQVGDTITIYCGYYDSCQNHYLDSLKVVVE